MTNPEIIIRSNDSVWPSALGAFSGAFFAFIFGMIAFYIQKRLERYWKHKSSVVELEHMLQDHLDQNASNQFLFKGAISTLQFHHMTYTLLTPLSMPEGIDLRIGDLEVLNKYFDYREPAIKVNHGMVSWQGLNEKLQQNVISNPNLPAPVVHKNMDHIKEQGEAMLKFLIGLDEDTKYFLAYITLYIRKDKHIWSKWLFKIKNKIFISEREIKEEEKSLEKNIKEVSKRSQERIAKIVGK